MSRPAPIRKTDLLPAFEAAKLAGFGHVSVLVETPDGHRYHITAGNAPDATPDGQTELQKWKAGRAT